LLVLIDCQKKYPASEKIIDQVIRQIRKAKSRNEWILEVVSGGRTLTRIKRHLTGYDKTVRISKTHDDGSTWIFDRIYGWHYSHNNNLSVKCIPPVKKFRVVGVNTTACILRTVNGLRRFGQVVVISDACANGGLPDKTYDPELNHRHGLRRMGTWKNVTIQ
jgi:hypothetical protein